MGFSLVTQTGKMSIISPTPPPPTSSMFTHEKSTMYFNPFTPEWPMQNHIPSTTCDVISFKGEGLHCHLTCTTEVKRSLKLHQNEHNSAKDAREKGKKKLCNVNPKILMKILINYPLLRKIVLSD